MGLELYGGAYGGPDECVREPALFGEICLICFGSVLSTRSPGTGAAGVGGTAIEREGIGSLAFVLY
jgi:hypothetical protein